MEKNELANTLKKRQPSQDLVPEKIIGVCSDDELIEGYVKWCYCGEKLADGALLDHIIAVSKSVEHFFHYFRFFHNLARGIRLANDALHELANVGEGG
jgi:hypothetical protein